MHRKPPRLLEIIHSQHSYGRHQRSRARWPAVLLLAAVLGGAGALFAPRAAAGPASPAYLSFAARQAAQVAAPSRRVRTDHKTVSRLVHLNAVRAARAARRAEAALDARQRFRLSYWDAAIIEASRALGCTHVLSEDLSDGQDYGGVQVINPFR